jgi:hypothetical protein
MKIRITSIPNLITFLKRLKSVEKNVILEITSDKIFSKVHTPDKAVMKYSSLNFSEVFEGTIEWKGKSKIKIGLIDVGRVIDAFKHFRPEEDVFLELTIQEEEGEYIASEMRLISNSLKIKLKCADLGLLSYVPDDILDMVHSKENSIGQFKIYQSDFNTIVSLCGMETNSEEILNFDLTKQTAYSYGDSFRYKLNIGGEEISIEGNEMTSSVYKNQFGYMEQETCKVYLHENRIVLDSESSSTSIAIGIVEK